MKFFTIATTLTLMASSIMAVPVEKRDGAPYEITYPTAGTVVQINQNLGITWNKGDNSPINIGLVAGADGTLSSNSIVIAEGLSGAIGSLVYPVSPSLGNSTSAWRIGLSHGSDPVVYSAPFYISSSTNQSQPHYTASSNNATYSAVASISILGPDGKPLTFGETSAAITSFASVDTMSYGIIPILLMSYILL
ncbi:unnamed protein product [Cunninghamella echinulata]